MVFLCSAVGQPVLSLSFGNSGERSEPGPVPSKQPLRDYCVRVRDPTLSRSAQGSPSPVPCAHPGALLRVHGHTSWTAPSFPARGVPRDSRGCHLFLSHSWAFPSSTKTPKGCYLSVGHPSITIRKDWRTRIRPPSQSQEAQKCPPPLQEQKG